MTAQEPATQNAGAVAAAQTTIRSTLMGDKMKKQFALALPKILPVDRFVRCLVTTINKTPELMECDQQSVLAAAMTAAQLGLEIDPVLGRAYMLPYGQGRGKTAQLIIGYKGYVDLAYRSGQLSGLQAQVVYEKDDFEYQYGLEPKLNHIPSDEADRGALKYAYAVATFKNGGNAWRVLNRSEVMSHKNRSAAKNSKYSPWNTEDEPAMWSKTAIRALSNILPLSPELKDAVATEDKREFGDKGLDIGEAIDVTEPTAVETTEAETVVVEQKTIAEEEEEAKEVDASPAGMAGAANKGKVL